jgi:carboxyl-terminal processing protease
MKNFFKILIFFVFITLQSCTDNEDNLLKDNDTEVQNFIWRGLNYYYLWQPNVPDLADNKFSNPYALNNFIAAKGSPENTFEQLLYRPVSLFPNSPDGTINATDRFSYLFEDYDYLENLFQGITINNGAKIKLYKKSALSNVLFGVVRYIIPNSDAANKNIHRGDLFYAINDTPLTISNYNSLLSNETYTLNFANFDSGNITPNGTSLSLTKSQITENPILINTTITQGSRRIAYLMYNSFTANFNVALNNAFGQIAATNPTDLVLDLRYNGGGSIQTAAYLASMITGQFNNQVFAKEVWNPRIQSYYESNNPSQLYNLFTNNMNGIGINSLNLSKVYIITTKDTASASELVINGLKPYIDVIQIGDVTIGKNAGSITLYDSKNFAKSSANPNHKYCMQPLVLKTANKNGFGDYQTGLVPNFSQKEDPGNMGVLGDINEPLLHKVLTLVGSRSTNIQQDIQQFESIEDFNSVSEFGNEMYLDKLPKDIYKAMNSN